MLTPGHWVTHCLIIPLRKGKRQFISPARGCGRLSESSRDWRMPVRYGRESLCGELGMLRRERTLFLGGEMLRECSGMLGFGVGGETRSLDGWAGAVSRTRIVALF
uniref:Uncharacterized protein n=1 Tax=Anopheles atroparvus TaxID=41427 RepID=A0AAG5DQV1_ANOAO